MREASKDPKRLKDILEAIDNVFQYVGNDDMQALVNDKMRYHAVVCRNGGGCHLLQNQTPPTSLPQARDYWLRWLRLFPVYLLR